MSSDDRNYANMLNVSYCLMAEYVSCVFFRFRTKIDTMIPTRSARRGFHFHFRNQTKVILSTGFNLKRNWQVHNGRLKKAPFFHLQDTDSADEVSDHEESDERLGATGNNHHGAAADTENETSAALWREETSASGGSDQGEKCSCNSSRPTRLAFEALQMRCMLCGGLINGSGTNREKVNRLVSSPTRMEGPGPLIGVVPPLFAESLPALPSTSLEDNTSEQDGGSPSSQQRAASLVTGRSWQKTPVHRKCLKTSVNTCRSLLCFDFFSFFLSVF